MDYLMLAVGFFITVLAWTALALLGRAHYQKKLRYFGQFRSVLDAMELNNELVQEKLFLMEQALQTNPAKIQKDTIKDRVEQIGKILRRSKKFQMELHGMRKSLEVLPLSKRISVRIKKIRAELLEDYLVLQGTPQR